MSEPTREQAVLSILTVFVDAAPSLVRQENIDLKRVRKTWSKLLAKYSPGLIARAGLRVAEDHRWNSFPTVGDVGLACGDIIRERKREERLEWAREAGKIIESESASNHHVLAGDPVPVLDKDNPLKQFLELYDEKHPKPAAVVECLAPRQLAGRVRATCQNLRIPGEEDQ